MIFVFDTPLWTSLLLTTSLHAGSFVPQDELAVPSATQDVPAATQEAASPSVGEQDEPPQNKSRQDKPDAHGLAPKKTTAEMVVLAEAARARGFAYLVATQNKDGSWGSHDPKVASLRDFGFKTTARGSHNGVRAACTAICARAFLEKKERSPQEERALQAAIEDLLNTEKFTYEKGEAFNTWGYGYKLNFLALLMAQTEDEDLRKRIDVAAQVCIRGLKRWQQADGGWCYYTDQMAGGESMSFNTGVFLLALVRAKEAGIAVPEGMLADAARLLRRMRTMRGGFIYDARFFTSASSVNELSAGSRSVACEMGLNAYGMSRKSDLLRTMEVFAEGENYLEDGRKLIMPHTAVHQISGYFFFFGYLYAAEILELLGPDASAKQWDRIAWTMLRTQEEDGSWWDTAAADYGDKWGTGFALQTLDHFMRYAAAAPSALATGEQADAESKAPAPTDPEASEGEEQ